MQIVYMIDESGWVSGGRSLGLFRFPFFLFILANLIGFLRSYLLTLFSPCFPADVFIH